MSFDTSAQVACMLEGYVPLEGVLSTSNHQTQIYLKIIDEKWPSHFAKGYQRLSSNPPP